MTLEDFWNMSDEEIIETRNFLKERIKSLECKVEPTTLETDKIDLEFLNEYIKKHINETN